MRGASVESWPSVGVGPTEGPAPMDDHDLTDAGDASVDTITQ